ncbi:MAG TPA: hypothetical protein VE954_08845 [Oligoflexus sp.]|uniref:hypothetical protein n=1 Tax=Oligoflexus sp. TaxID=1971216 RepID=UPI002D3D744C|nr:hypothetical protein [Oligoflexus sp.]HYX33210.1 hypothetical protein [Oligoflexus sp.]
MIYIQHRINTLEQLEDLNPGFGAEIDLRSDPNSHEIYLHHDPFIKGVSFNDWISLFAKRGIRGPLILNTKEDGLEAELIVVCESHGIRNFFFLDTALPTLVKWACQKSERRFACRLSAYEPFEALEKFKGKADWLWVDCFEGRPLPVTQLQAAKEHFKLCLVAPELQGVSEVDPAFRAWFNQADAICTKKPAFWQKW